jgi:ketosteroid isomerase-like protein
MKQILGAIAVVLWAAIVAAPGVHADQSDEVRALYRQFAAAQNMRDLEAVGGLLLDSDKFLWVSDGKSIWGRAAALKRMALFQEARIWHVEPDLDDAVVVSVGGDAAFLHLPLELRLAFSAAEPERLRFLVSVLCVKTPEGWHIAALFTATQNPT